MKKESSLESDRVFYAVQSEEGSFLRVSSPKGNFPRENYSDTLI